MLQSSGPASNGYGSSAPRPVGSVIGNNGIGPIGGLGSFLPDRVNGGAPGFNNLSAPSLGSSGPWSTGGMTTMPNVIGNGRSPDFTYLPYSTLKQYQVALKYQLELVEKALSSHEKNSPIYSCLNCKQKGETINMNEAYKRWS